MTPKDLIERYNSHPAILQLITALGIQSGVIHATGMVGSSKSLTLAKIYLHLKGLHFVVMENEDQASMLFNDLSNLVGAKHVLFLPSAFKSR